MLRTGIDTSNGVSRRWHGTSNKIKTKQCMVQLYSSYTSILVRIRLYSCQIPLLFLPLPSTNCARVFLFADTTAVFERHVKFIQCVWEIHGRLEERIIYVATNTHNKATWFPEHCSLISHTHTPICIVYVRYKFSSLLLNDFSLVHMTNPAKKIKICYSNSLMSILCIITTCDYEISKNRMW